MIAFVMSGGGNRGALQAGALLRLLEEGIKPDILVGTSAGAINASYLATNPTLQGAQRLVELWSTARKDDLFPGSWFSMIGRLAQGLSLFPSDALRAFLEQHLPPDKRCFGDLKDIKLFITAANMNRGKLYLYGDLPQASIINAVMASTAHPLAFPPLKQDDVQLVDGGVVANVPIGIAIDKGATEIYVLNVGYGGTLVQDGDNILEVLSRSIQIMMYQPFLLDLKHGLARSDINVHHISMTEFQGSQLWELEHGAEMVAAGRLAAHKYLSDPTGLGDVTFAPPEEEEPPEGAEPYLPSWMRV